MKRSRIGIWLLLALLVMGIFVSRGMAKRSQPIGESVSRAGEAALRGDWEEATALTEQARAEWEKHWGFCATFADQDPMEHINSLFAQLEVYAQCRDGENYAALCALLSENLKAIGEAHSLNWWNLL